MLPALLALALAVTGCGQPSAASQAASEPAPTPIEVAPLEPFRAPVADRVEPGDTLESISRRLAGDDWVRWRDALAEVIDPRRLPPGLQLQGAKDRDGELERLRVVLDLRSELQLELVDGELVSRRMDRPITSQVERLEGVIEGSLFEAVAAAGANAELAVRLAEIFQWDVDFFRDLRRGDRFVVVVDRQLVDGAFYQYGTLFMARFVNQGRTLDAIAFPDDEGRLGYYDPQGRTLRKQFLRSPLKFSRVTSRFSSGRFHPILKRRMPHYGVDYGAPTGTPAHVTADGVVTFVGRNGGAGNMITVRHPNGYETSYLHLSRYAKGMRRGVRVHQGQVIGYVGATGYATGPHLDYRVKLNGRWIDPLRISSPPAKPLEGDRLRRFLAHALASMELLEGRPPPEGASA